MERIDTDPLHFSCFYLCNCRQPWLSLWVSQILRLTYTKRRIEMHPLRLSDKLEFDGEKHHVSHFIRFLKTAYLFLFIGSLILNATLDGIPAR